jgi:hypothetical protein
MKNFSEKLAMGLSVFSPIILLIFIWSAYLYTPQKEEQHLEMKEKIKNNMQQHFFQSFDGAKEHKSPSSSIN